MTEMGSNEKSRCAVTDGSVIGLLHFKTMQNIHN